MEKGFIATLAAVGILFGSSASAQGPAAEVAAARLDVAVHDVAVRESSSGYLQLTYDGEGLQAALIGNGEAVVLPTLRTAALVGETDTGFGAFHAYTSLSEVVGYYWDALTRLGFEGAVASASADTTVYTFESGEGPLKATFTQGVDGVTSSLSWAQAESTDLGI